MRAALGRTAVFCSAAILGGCVASEGRPVAIGQGQYLVGAPYTVDGVTYTPAESFAYEEIGFATIRDIGGTTANGDRFDPDSLVAAHPTLQLPSFVRVTNLANDRSLVLMVNDRGPGASDRLIAVSARAAELLVLAEGAPVRVAIMAAESRAVADLAGRGAGPLDGPALAATPVSAEPLREPSLDDLATDLAGPDSEPDAGPDALVEVEATTAVVDGPVEDDAAPVAPLPPAPPITDPAAAVSGDARAVAIAEARRLAELSGDADADRESRVDAGLPSDAPVAADAPADPATQEREADLAALIDAAMADRVSDRPDSPALVDGVPDAAAAAPALLGEDDIEMATLFYVQFGVFRELANAERLRQQLVGEGDTIVSPYEQEDETLYRVWLGPFETDAVAEQTLRRLIDDGIIDEAHIIIN